MNMFGLISSWFSYIVSTVVLIKLVEILIQNGFASLLKAIAAFLVSLPGIKGLVKSFTKREVKGFIKGNFAKAEAKKRGVMEIPEKGKNLYLY